MPVARGSSARAGVLALLASAGLLLASCSSPSGGQPASAGSGPSVVTPAAVRRVVAPTMSRNNRANDALNSRLLSSYEAGSAFALDNATYRAERLAEKKSGYTIPNTAFTIRQDRFALQRDPSFPAQFLVGGRTVLAARHGPKVPPCDSLMDFEKKTAGSRWKIVLEPSTGPHLPKLALRGGYAAPVSGRLVRRADSLPDKVAADLMSFETTGRLGHLKRSNFTGNCWQLPDPRLDVVNSQASGYAARDLYSAVHPADTAVFALQGGAALALFTIAFKDQLIAPGPSSPISWSHPSLKKQPAGAWTYLIPTGRYLEITERGLVQVAAIVSPTGYSVVGDYLGFTSVSGRRAKGGGKKTPGGTLADLIRPR